MKPVDVQTFLAQTTHPKRDILLALRDVIRGADPTLHEHIKWNAPSYQAGGDDRITFNLSRPGCRANHPAPGGDSERHQDRATDDCPRPGPVALGQRSSRRCGLKPWIRSANGMTGWWACYTNGSMPASLHSCPCTIPAKLLPSASAIRLLSLSLPRMRRLIDGTSE